MSRTRALSSSQRPRADWQIALSVATILRTLRCMQVVSYEAGNAQLIRSTSSGITVLAQRRVITSLGIWSHVYSTSSTER